jgi:hypothetical protein
VLYTEQLSTEHLCSALHLCTPLQQHCSHYNDMVKSVLCEDISNIVRVIEVRGETRCETLR